MEEEALVAYILFILMTGLDGDRYKIIHKLGFGDFSTAWLARDRVLQKYVASKINEAGISKFHNELEYKPRSRYIIHAEGLHTFTLRALVTVVFLLRAFSFC